MHSMVVELLLLLLVYEGLVVMRDLLEMEIHLLNLLLVVMRKYGQLLLQLIILLPQPLGILELEPHCMLPLLRRNDLVPQGLLPVLCLGALLLEELLALLGFDLLVLELLVGAERLGALLIQRFLLTLSFQVLLPAKRLHPHILVNLRLC